MLKKLLSVKFRKLAMHGHVGLLTDINGSVTDELPIKYIVSFDIRLPYFFKHFLPILDNLHSKLSRRGMPQPNPR